MADSTAERMNMAIDWLKTTRGSEIEQIKTKRKHELGGQISGGKLCI